MTTDSFFPLCIPMKPLVIKVQKISVFSKKKIISYLHNNET